MLDIAQELYLTPYTSTNLPGITRETVMELAEKMGIKVIERPFTLFDVWASSEAFRDLGTTTGTPIYRFPSFPRRRGRTA